MTDNIHLSRFQPNSDKSGFIGTAQYSWAEGYFHRGRFKDYALFDNNITLGRLADDTPLNALVTDKLYNIQGSLYWGGQMVLTGSVSDLAETLSSNRFLNWESISQAPLYDTAVTQSDSGKYLKVEGNNLVWHKPIITWTDVSSAPYTAANIGQVLSVRSTGLFWDNKFDLSTLPLFGSGDSVDLNDMVGVEDISANINKKVSVKELIEKYHLAKAEEQNSDPDTVTNSDGGEVANPSKNITSSVEWIDLDGDGVKETPRFTSTTPVTAENLDSLISADSGMEIIETCYNATYDTVDCEINGVLNPEVAYKTKKLSIAKNDTAKNFYAIVSSNKSALGLGEGEYNWTNAVAIDWKVNLTALGGMRTGRESLTIGKTYNNEFNSVRAALLSLNKDVPAGGTGFVLVKGDVMHDHSFGLACQFDNLMILDYNYWCMIFELNASGGPHGDKKWRSGEAYVTGNCVYNKDAEDGASATVDHEVYRCIKNHTSSNRPDSDPSNWVRLTPHNCHLAFSVSFFGDWFINSVQGNGTYSAVDPFSADSPWNAGSAWSAQYKNDRYNYNLDWGGQNAKYRCVIRCAMPVSDSESLINAFHCWISSMVSIGMYGIKFVFTLGSRTNGQAYQAGFIRFGMHGQTEININYVDFHFNALPEANRQKTAYSFFELVAGCWVRVFDSGWGATIHDPYNTGKRKHGMAFYCDNNVYAYTIFDVEDGWLMLGNEYWGYAQKGGLRDNSRFHWGSNFKANTIFKVENSSTLETGNATWSYSPTVLFSNTRGLLDGSGQTNGHMPSSWLTGGGVYQSTTATGPTSLSALNWNTSGAQLISIWADQFSKIKIGENFQYLPGRTIKLATSDGWVSYPDISRITLVDNFSSYTQHHRNPADSSSRDI